MVPVYSLCSWAMEGTASWDWNLHSVLSKLHGTKNGPVYVEIEVDGPDILGFKFSVPPNLIWIEEMVVGRPVSLLQRVNFDVHIAYGDINVWRHWKCSYLLLDSENRIVEVWVAVGLECFETERQGINPRMWHLVLSSPALVLGIGMVGLRVYLDMQKMPRRHLDLHTETLTTRPFYEYPSFYPAEKISILRN